jgi:hypothetical protein
MTDVTVANLGDAGASLPGGALVLESVSADEAVQQMFDAELASISPQHRIERSLIGYCLNFTLGVPPAGTLFRVAPESLQRQFAPLKRILDAGSEARRLALLKPDSDPGDYFHSIRQWALWSELEGFDSEAAFTEAFIEHTRKNVEAAGQEWTDEIAEAVAGFTLNRWDDIETVLRRAGAPE